MELLTQMSSQANHRRVLHFAVTSVLLGAVSCTGNEPVKAETKPEVKTQTPETKLEAEKKPEMEFAPNPGPNERDGIPPEVAPTTAVKEPPPLPPDVIEVEAINEGPQPEPAPEPEKRVNPGPVKAPEPPDPKVQPIRVNPGPKG
jgi:type IV secretory pathway VirB10-like protein